MASPEQIEAWRPMVRMLWRGRNLAGAVLAVLPWPHPLAGRSLFAADPEPRPDAEQQQGR